MQDAGINRLTPVGVNGKTVETWKSIFPLSASFRHIFSRISYRYLTLCNLVLQPCKEPLERGKILDNAVEHILF